LTPRGTGRMGVWHDTPDWSTRAAPAGNGYPARSDRGTGLRIGQAVEHARFGEGVVVDIEGQGDDARAQANFGPSGVKWLARSVAKLTPRWRFTGGAAPAAHPPRPPRSHPGS